MRELLVSLIIGLLIVNNTSVFGFEPENMDCAINNLDYVKFLYKSNIEGINDAVRLYEESHPGYNMKSLVDYMYNPFLNKASDSAKCLLEFGIDPSTVAQLSPAAQKVFNYDPDGLSKMAPLFVKYVPIPEFGSYTLLATALMFFVILSYKVSNTIRKQYFT